MKNSDMPAMPQDGDLFCKKMGECPTLGTGLTKREHFAAMAMQGILSNSSINALSEVNGMMSDLVSGVAVNYADALLERLNK